MRPSVSRLENAVWGLVILCHSQVADSSFCDPEIKYLQRFNCKLHRAVEDVREIRDGFVYTNYKT